MKKLIFSLFFIISFSYGFEINYDVLKLKVLRFYPAKSRIYEKEPVFIRFDVKITENKTGIKKEILLKNLILKPLDSKIILFQQEKFIYLKEKKSTIKNLLYLKQGNSYFPFSISFNIEKLQGILEENILKKLSKKIIVKKRQSVYISPVPKNMPYVGDFNIDTYLEDKKGTATLYIKITGKGFPKTPNYSLVVKNGSAKKIGSFTENKMGYITSIQKYKIVYMDELEVLPVKFKYFDPYVEKIIEKKTKTLRISPKREEKIPIKKIPREERIRFYIDSFRRLYPEYFQKTSPINIALGYLYSYKKYILTIILLFLLAGFFYVRKIFVKEIPPEIKEIINIPEENLSTIKKLYKYFSKENIPEYYKVIDTLLYRSQIFKKNNKILKVKTEEKEYSPKDIIEVIHLLKNILINQKLNNLSRKTRVIVKLWLFTSRNFYGILIFSFVIAASLLIQFFIEKYPQLAVYLNGINFILILAGTISFLLVKKPILRE